MPPKGSKSKRTSRTPSKSPTPQAQSDEDESLIYELLELASRKYPSLISKSAFIGRVCDITSQSDGRNATIWMSESAMVNASIPPGSLISTSLAAPSKKVSNGSPLDSLANGYESEAARVTEKIGNFFALAIVFPSCKVLKNEVKLSWSLSQTMGSPHMGRVVFISLIKSQTEIQTQNGTNKFPNSTNLELSCVPLNTCKDLYLEVVPSSHIPSGCHGSPSLICTAVESDNNLFNKGDVSSPKTPSSSRSNVKSRSSDDFLSIGHCSSETFDMTVIRTALEDKQTKELLQISSSYWLASRILLHGNVVVVPICGMPCLFLVKEASKLSHVDSNGDMSYKEKNDLTSIIDIDAAFVVGPETKVHLFASTKENLKERGLSIAKEEEFAISKLGGLSKESAQLKEVIFEKILHNANYTGVLLHGPPGTGKTLLAHCCVYDAGVKLFLINGPEITSQDYGKSEQALQKVFHDARQEAPAVVFIDELDAIAPIRKDGGESLSHRMVVTLLNLMDEAKTCKLLVIGATNRPDNIDSALRRHGRFDREIEIGVPSKEQRLDILLTLLKDMKHSLANSEIEYIASTTHGFVGADLASLCNEAALTSLQHAIKLKSMHAEAGRVTEPIYQIDSLQLLLSNLSLSAGPVLSPHISNTIGTTAAFQDAVHIDDNNGAFVEEEPLLRITLDHFEVAKMKVRPSAMREVTVEVPKVRWEDIGGQEEIKKQLREAVEWPQKHHEAFQRVGIHPPTGVLMFGPPGCSKTLMARAVASNAGLNFLAVKGPELFSKWVGESEKAVRSLFAKARAAAPSIIFFDEIDGLAITRGKENDGASVGDRVMSQLLVELDGLSKRVDVTVIAATNRPDKIDAALLRPGRFDRLLYVGPPNETDREAIFRIHLRKMPCSSDVNLKELAHLTKGCTGADISSICREAALAALEENLDASEVSMSHFKVAISMVQPTEVQPYEEFSTKFQRLVCTDNGIK
ncbi:calmodulin-interacting protein 111 [Aristolochia californica]|uniref:calmodulin-interacting protein 111 n=1 Tax=Aristolochia californica TaxID=171875 RepID=UPI0035E0EC20